MHILLFSVYVILFVFVLLICMLMFTWYTFCCCALQYTYMSCIHTLQQSQKKKVGEGGEESSDSASEYNDEDGWVRGWGVCKELCDESVEP